MTPRESNTANIPLCTGNLSLYLRSGNEPFVWKSSDGAFLVLLSATRQVIGDPGLFVRGFFEDPGAVLLALNGDFLVAAGYRARMLVAVDPLGIRAAYYAKVNGQVCVTDWSGSFVGHGLVPRKAEPTALFHYLNFMCVPTPWSAWRGVRRIPPGVYLDVSDAKENSVPPLITERRYWDIPFATVREPETILRQKLRAQIERAVAEAVAQASGGHVLGAFLSGGTDSSTIVGLASRRLGRPLPAYVAYFEDEAASELHYAQVAAKHFELDLRPVLITPEDFLASVPWMVECFDEPYANTSVVAARACTRAARRDGVTAMLAGDGGDEIFGGNARYAKDKILSWYVMVPWLFRVPVEWVFAHLPAASYGVSRLRKAIWRANVGNPERFGRDEAFASVYWNRLLSPEFLCQVKRDASENLLREYWKACGAEEEINRLLCLDLKLTIADNDLRKIMAAATLDGVAVLFPFLDRALVEFALSVPAHLKVRGLTLRYLFKQAVADLLPVEIVNKKKHGMGIPLDRWFRDKGPLRDFVEEVLLGRNTCVGIYVQKTCVQRLWDEHQRGIWNYAQELWRVVMLGLWHRVHLNGEEAISLIHPQ